MSQKIIDLCNKIEAGYAAEKSGLDDDMVELLVELADWAAEIRAACTPPPVVGDRYTNIKPEEDLDESSTTRIIPAGSEWYVTSVHGRSRVHIVCEATGDWLAPTMAELCDPTLFVKVSNPK